MIQKKRTKKTISLFLLLLLLGGHVLLPTSKATEIPQENTEVLQEPTSVEENLILTEESQEEQEEPSPADGMPVEPTSEPQEEERQEVLSNPENEEIQEEPSGEEKEDIQEEVQSQEDSDMVSTEDKETKVEPEPETPMLLGAAPDEGGLRADPPRSGAVYNLTIQNNTVNNQEGRFIFAVYLYNEDGSQYVFNGTFTGYTAGSPSVGQNGDIIMTLIQGTSVTLNGIPEGKTYKVVPSEKQGWEVVSKTNDEGTIDGDKTAVFTSDRYTKQVTIKKIWEGDEEIPDDLKAYVNIEHAVSYAVYDSTTKTLTFFRDDEGKYTNNQVIGSKTYYANVEETGGTSFSAIPWSGVSDQIKKIDFQGTIIPIRMGHWFSFMSNLEEVTNLQYLDTSQCLGFGTLFRYSPKIKELDLSSFDTSKAVWAALMFDGCTSLEHIYVSDKWTLSTLPNAETITNFTNCTKMHNWDGNVTMSKAHYGEGGYLEYKAPTPAETAYNAIRMETEPGGWVKNGREWTYTFTVPGDAIVSSAGEETLVGFELVSSTREGDTFTFVNRYSTNDLAIEKQTVDNVPGSFQFRVRIFKNLGTLDGEAYVSYDSATHELVFFRDEAGKYTNNQVIGTKTYWTGIETSVFTYGRDTTSPEGWYEHNSDAPWNSVKNQVTKVIFKAPIKPISTANWFLGMYRLEEFVNLSYLDTSEVTNMRCMFDVTNIQLNSGQTTVHPATWAGGAGTPRSPLKELDVSHFNTSKVTDMRAMFSGLNGLESLDLSNFDTSNVTDMGTMFDGADQLTELDLSTFDTSKVTTMQSMFFDCEKLETIKGLESFNTSNVTTMYAMFEGCVALKNADLSRFDFSAVAENTGIPYMLYNCRSLNTSLYIHHQVVHPYTDRYVAMEPGAQLTLYRGEAIDPDFWQEYWIDHPWGSHTANNPWLGENVVDGGLGTPVPPEEPKPFKTPISNYRDYWYDEVVTIDAGDSLTISDIPEGYEFEIEELEQEGWTLVSSTNASGTLTDDTTSTWVNEVATYTVTFDPNGGVLEGSEDPVKVTARYKEEITIKDAPTREGYTFLHWKDPVINPGTIYPVTEDHTFIAMWKPALEDPTKTITITKKWENDDDAVRPDSLTLHLKKTSAFLQTGLDLRNAMVELAGGAADAIGAIRKAEKGAYDAAVAAGKTIKDLSESDEPVYFWFDNGTIYYYSPASNIYMNANSARVFNKMTSLADISGLEFWNTTYVTDMNRMFQDDWSLRDLSALAKWDTGNVTDMTFMFGANYSGRSGTPMSIESFAPLAKWNTQKVTSTNQMFKGCLSVTSVAALKNWNLANLKDASQMFNRCSLTDPDVLSAWDLSRVNEFRMLFANQGDEMTPAEGLPIFVTRPGTWNENGWYTPDDEPLTDEAPTTTKTFDTKEEYVSGQDANVSVTKNGATWTYSFEVSNDGSSWSLWEEVPNLYTVSDGSRPNIGESEDNAIEGVIDSATIVNTYPPRYTVSYVYYGELPTQVQNTLPTDTGKYFDTTTISAKAPSQNIVKVGDKTYTFQGWDASTKTIAGANITFTGTWSVKEDPKPDPMVTITYDLNGGSYKGSNANIVETYIANTVITIHEAPQRNGYTFLYWKGSEYQPGDTYTAAADHTFVAQWEKNPSPVPNTGDTTTLGGWLFILGATLAGIGWLHRKKKQNS